jgi:hypothetical protein
MSRMRFGVLLLLIPAFLAAAVSLPGCDDGKTKVPPIRGDGEDDGEGGGGFVERKPLETTGWAENWVGTITYDGTPPTPFPLAIPPSDPVCHSMDAIKAGDTVNHMWIVNPGNKGVKNAVVFLEPVDKGTYFKIKDEDKALKEAPYLDQPHCSYRPHVVAYFASYYNEEESKNKSQSVYNSTGKGLMVYNTSATGHNIKFVDVSAASKEVGKVNLGPDPQKRSPAEVKLQPQKTPIGVKCDIHAWMQGYVWAFEHPYFAVTDENGKFTMPSVPTGKEVRVVVWHEGAGGFVTAGNFRGKDGMPITFGETNEPLTLQIKSSS